MKYSWDIPSIDESLAKELSLATKLPEAVIKILIHRGYHTADAITDFLNPDISQLYDPFLFRDMEKAVNRIITAINSNETIMIHGDYDIDGLTATAILYKTLKQFTPHLITYIPHRLLSGYGIKEEAVREAVQKKVSLIITVDCGITAVDEIELANQNGIDVILTDHHLHLKKLPNAHAIIHTSLPGEIYPYKDLSGAGVAFKLAQAVESRVAPLFHHLTEHMMDLAAAGTLGDIVPLTGENRIIAKYGLIQMKNTHWPGLQALLSKTKLTQKNLDSWHIGFILGPRINAAGRMGDADTALELLCSDSYEDSLEISDKLEDYNIERKDIVKDLYKQAKELVETQIDLDKESIIVLGNPDWHIGVLGIVASKIVDDYNRPVIMIDIKDEIGKGSGRSVEGFHILKGLEYCDQHLEGYGGHEMACGLSILPGKIMDFRKAINQYANEVSFDYHAHARRGNLDAEISMSDLTKEFSSEMNKLEPYGTDNEEPVLLFRGMKITSPPWIIKETHLKLRVSNNGWHGDAMWFSHADRADEIRKSLGALWDIQAKAKFKEYKGIASIELNVQDMRPSK